MFAALVVTAFLATGVGVLLANQEASRADLHDQIVWEMSAMRSEATAQGTESAIEEVVERTMIPGGLGFRLKSKTGESFGELAFEADQPGWREIVQPPASEKGRERKFLVWTERLPDGALLTVGGDLARHEGIRHRLLFELAIFGLIAAVASAAIGWWTSSRMLRRMDALSDTLTAAAEGDLSVRLAAPARPVDDLDAVALAANTMLERMQTLVANLRRVTTEVAHQLRTPLSLVRQDIEIAHRTAPEDVRARLISAETRLAGLSTTFDAMLRLAEIEAKRSRSGFVHFALADVADNVAAAYRPEVEDIGGELVLEVRNGAPVEGDPDLMTQAVANLVENAIRYAGPAPQIRVSLDADDESWSLAVSDAGPGISADDRSRVLEPFVRAQSAGSTRGSGLGLAIVAAVARLHRAQLVLEDAAPGLRARIVARRQMAVA